MTPDRADQAQDTARAVDRRVVRTRYDVLRAAIQVLFDEGLTSVTHQHVADVAGYSKATLYAHWPAPNGLLVDAFNSFIDVHHHTPTGELRSDLIEELWTFRRAMIERRVDRALAVLVDLAASVPELIAVRQHLVTEGERVIRGLLASSLAGTELEAATLMLCGAIVHSALTHGQIPSEELIETSVDLMLRGIGWTESPR